VSRKLGFHPGWVTVAVCAMLLGGAALPSASLASTTIGSDLSAAESVLLGGTARTFVNTALPVGAPPVTSPIAGTIVRWRIKTAGGGVGTITLRVIASPVPNAFTGAGTGHTETTPTSATTTTFSTELPIQAGDYIGVDVSSGGGLPAFATAQPGANVAEFAPPPSDGGSLQTPSSTDSNIELLLNADVAALPTSSVTVPACSNTGKLQARVTSDPDPAVAPKAIHFRIDGGGEQVIATSHSGNQGSAAIPVPQGSHMLEYWGEDTVGGLESTHNTASVLVDTIAPVVSITSDQSKATFAQGEVASISVAASDSGTGLQTDPSGHGEVLPTNVPGKFKVTRSATDRCGNSTAASFTYTVLKTMTKVSQSQRRWREGKALPHMASVGAPVGTTFRFTLNGSARVLFAFKQRLPGRRVNGRCVASTSSNRSRPACTRLVARGKLSFTVGPGTHKLRFQGRLSKHRRLPVGRYTLVITATNAFGQRTTARLTFKIVAG
jgi:hypothetical protein